MQKNSFFLSLERYGWKLTARNPLPYPWILVGLGLAVLITSLSGTSMISAASTVQAIRIAADRGDYPLAQQLYNPEEVSVLGASSELEAVVYPERPAQTQITNLEEKLVKYPGNREIYLMLATLYGQLGNQEKQNEYQENARVLDPNN